MAFYDSTMKLPDSWIQPMDRLTYEAGRFTYDLSCVSGIVEQGLANGHLGVPSDILPEFQEKFSLAILGAPSVMSHVNELNAAVAQPTWFRLGQQDIQFGSPDLFVKSTESILASAASMAASVRSATAQICVNTNPGMGVFKLDDETIVLNYGEQALAAPTMHNPVLELGDTLQTNVATFGHLADTSLASSRLSAEIFYQPLNALPSYLVDMGQEITSLYSQSAAVYDDLASSRVLDPHSLLFQAPTIEPYAAMQVAGVLAGIDEEKLDQCRLESTDTFLDELGDELVSRLRSVNPELAEVYSEGIAAIESGHKGWIRHAGVSFRTMFKHLLRELAPNSVLDSFFEDPEKEKLDGEYSRNAQLRYIFRDVATGSYEKMAEQDIKIAEATFFPSNEVVHKLKSPLSEKQMRVLWRRIQGTVSVVLEASGC